MAVLSGAGRRLAIRGVHERISRKGARQKSSARSSVVVERDRFRVQPNGSPSFAKQIADCARQLEAGELSALGRLFDLAGARLVRYAQMLTRNQDDAEDALQGAMIRVARNPSSLAGSQHPWAYFLKIVRNEALRILNRKQPRNSLTELLQVWTRDEARLEQEEWRTHVQTALKRLPAEQAEVVVLKIWEEMTFLEISVVTGESANTVASRYRYALAKLSHYLQPIADEVCDG